MRVFDSTKTTSAESETVRVTLCLFAALKDAAQAEEVTVSVATPATIGSALRALGERHPETRPILPRCACFVDDAITRDRSRTLATNARIDVLPPFAGG